MENIKGVVKTIITQGDKRRSNVFDISTSSGSNETIRCNYADFLPLRVGDLVSIHGFFVSMGSHRIFQVKKQPMVFLATSENNIKNCFIRALKSVGPTRAKRIYDELKKIIKQRIYDAGYEEDSKGYAKAIEDFLDEVSSNSHFLSSEGNFSLGDLSKKETQGLLVWWRKNVGYRKLYLLGLNNREINGSHIPVDRLYKQCLENPFVVLSIPLEKAESINHLLEKPVTEKERTCGKIIRKINEYNNKGWTGVPVHIMKKIFYNYEENLMTLKKEYGVHEENNLVYNDYPHEVETYVTRIVDILIRETVKERRKLMDMPILDLSPTPNAIENGRSRPDKNTELGCLKFNKNLTDEQFQAVTGSLSSYISIITGAGGTGKCIGEGTMIKMYNGPDKAVEDIKTGDLVMGDDYTPRRVLSLHEGYDQLYKIKFKDGDFFVCNSRHTLCLKDSTLSNIEMSAENFYNLNEEDKEDLYSYRSLPPRNGRKIAKLVETEIERDEFGKYYGFETDGNHKFLLPNLIVVHNSTVLKEIVDNIISREENYICASFTGKAVARINQILGEKSQFAYTVDRLIQLKDPDSQFQNLIIDEASMVTTELMFRLFKKFNKLYRLILIGDCNQLPPIGWGSFFSQLFKTERVPIYYLTRNYRIERRNPIPGPDETPAICSSEKEDRDNFERVILKNANGLVDPKRDLSVPYVFEDGNGFYQLNGDLQTVYTLIEALHKKGVPTEKIAVLTPFNKNIKEIVGYHQKVYLEKEECFEDMHENYWKKGDPVMQIVNNYNINVMNGEEGEVVQIGDDGIIVKFDGEPFKYRYEPFRNDAYEEYNTETPNELLVKQIKQSFAKTVHKSQGSEYEFVIFYIPKNSTSFLNKNLLYTGITRTKKTIWLVGDRATILAATMRGLPIRHERLAERLKELKREDEDFLNDVTLRRDIELEKNYTATTTDEVYEDFENEYEDEDYHNRMWGD